MAGSHSTATRRHEDARDGWVHVPLVRFCRAGVALTSTLGGPYVRPPTPRQQSRGEHR